VCCLIVVPLPQGRNPFAVYINNNNSIQFDSILVYLRGNLTALKPITKLARVRRNNNKTLTNKIQNKAVYVIQ
jgi:hypothetical protein